MPLLGVRESPRGSSNQKLNPLGKLREKLVVPKKKEKWDKSDKKVGTAWHYAKSGLTLFAAALGKLLSLVLRLKIIRIPVTALSEALFGSDRQRLKKGYAQAMGEHFTGLVYEGGEFTAPNKALDLKKVAAFESKIQKFSDALPKLASDPEELRTAIVKLSKDEMYLILKDSEHPGVKFLQECGKRLESVDATEILKQYGSKKIGYMDDHSLSYGEFVDVLMKEQWKFGSNRDGMLATTLWGFDHLSELAHVESAHLNPLKYDTYQNQMVFVSTPLKDGEHEIIHKYSPGLTGLSSIVEDVLIPAYKKEGRRWIHIDNQSIHTADEKMRIQETHRIADDNKDVFLHAVLSTDSPEKLNQHLSAEYCKGNLSTQEFIEKYEKALRGDHNQLIRDFDQCKGIHIPTELLDDTQLDAAFTAARNMILNYPNLQEIDHAVEGQKTMRASLVDVVRRNILSTLSWAIMKKEQLRENRVPSIFTENCKENIDRGPQENLDLIFNDDMANGYRLMSQPAAKLQLGINLGRAHYAMDRPPQEKRIQPLAARLKFFEDLSAFKNGQEALSSLRQTLTA